MNRKSIPILLSAILVTVVSISATNSAVAQGTWTTGAPIPIAQIIPFVKQKKERFKPPSLARSAKQTAGQPRLLV